MTIGGAHTILELTLGKEQVTMVQTALILILCLLLGLVSILACVWVIVTGQLLTMDGLLLTAISLLFGTLFVANVVWSVFRGEGRPVLDALLAKVRKRGRQGNASGSELRQSS